MESTQNSQTSVTEECTALSDLCSHHNENKLLLCIAQEASYDLSQCDAVYVTGERENIKTRQIH